MNKLYFLKAMLLLIVDITIFSLIQAQNLHVIDVNKIKNSNPSNFQSSTQEFAELNGIFYFSADDGIHGNELWSSNGTNATTQLLKDIAPGTTSSNPRDITTVGNRIYFTAYNEGQVLQLWTSDGTDAGTQSLIDLVPTGPNIYQASDPYFTNVNGTLYFFISYDNFNVDPYYINQLWKTDGMAEGTQMVIDLVSAFNANYVGNLINSNGRLFFTQYVSELGTELYTSDGSPQGTTIVSDINPNPYAGSNPSHLTSLNGLLYFSADDGSGNKLWVSDGTATGTYAVPNSNNIMPSGFDNSPFTILDNVLFFQGNTDASGIELCKYDPSNATNEVQLVKDIAPGANSSYPASITNVNGVLFFTVGPSGEDAALWKSDGTDAGTMLVKDINPGGENIYSNLINVNGSLFFSYGNDELGNELWKSDGTTAGTILVKDIFSGPPGSFPQFLTYKNGLLLFAATDAKKGSELWKSDGTESGTTLVKDINQTSTASSYPYGFAAINNNKVIFSAGGLYVTNNTDAGTKKIGAPDISYQVNFKNKIYLLDYSYQLWQTNGTKEGTSAIPIPSIVDPSTEYVTNMVATESLIYIVSSNFATNQSSLWRTDGTPEGTYVLKTDLTPGFEFPTALGNTLFFGTYNEAHGVLWKTDGTVAGTVVVKGITQEFSYYPVLNIYNFKGRIYFVSYAPEINNYSLWTSDGTEAGTKVLKPVGVDFYSQFAQANGKLFFYALNAVSKGYELFASDGTPRGTRLVKDINKGAASSTVRSPVSGDTLIYFIADDGKHGAELWKSNGTKEGTSLVKNITPGINGTNIYQMVNAGNKLFFTVNDTLWQSDGTKINTHPVKDDLLKGVTQIGNLAVIDGKVYFSGYTYHLGQELYVGSASGDFAPVSLVTNNTLISNPSENEFAAKLLTNPVTDQLKFTVSVKMQQEARIIITDLSGRVLTSAKQILSAGINTLSYSSSSWAKGIYLINIETSGKFNATLKALK
ncbi:MAG: ELWxxDGT repeat protein [Ginsengibacter sp.]